ncbi:MAG: hypothetical protein II510_02840 [Erysipelotrichales bacterium]|nr:hypothetical protein [Erysipelotrichales bacterium]
MAVPVYIFTGFIESGKTTLIDETLHDEAFNTGERTLLLVLEQGIEEFDEKKAAELNTHIEYIDDFENGMSLKHLNELNAKYKPERVMIEYNGTWKVEDFLNSKIPAGWEIAQIVATADASTFENYVNNMKSFMYEQLRFADPVIFNRCSPKIKKSFLRSNVRAYNRSAQLIYENTEGEIENMDEDDLPFDLSKDSIEISPDDYGIWYMDALDHPQKYSGKTLSFTGMAYPTTQWDKPIVAIGRFALVCCAQDKQFIGVGIVDQDGKGLRPASWMKVKGKVRIDYDPESQSDYISLTQSTLKPAKPLEHPDVVF